MLCIQEEYSTLHSPDIVSQQLAWIPPELEPRTHKQLINSVVTEFHGMKLELVT